eukprot:CAMPEP_0119342518 /NCGR_PEP_ID=MMETSP1333-20130426/104885_1 /TAXON_ID=418940 /ORGANISM="Scyphosphaera apsteinii, Strain RCC1455" /LENGTH=126 /DNA_ID=CAMNT_0007354749 /DNA_START=25 /DNA_END=402 /DNA_ORIENTATION=+
MAAPDIGGHRLGPFLPEKGESPTLERCEAFEPSVDLARSEKYIAKSKFGNPLTAFMASTYLSQAAQHAQLREHLGSNMVKSQTVRLASLQKFAPPFSHGKLTEDKARQAGEAGTKPRHGDMRFALW